MYLSASRVEAVVPVVPVCYVPPYTFEWLNCGGRAECGKPSDEDVNWGVVFMDVVEL
jgi:hypothetical protein